ncbi:MAG: SGNH/GDSL hydrolase family protein [Vulcanimicrobiaceae bacterium]
MLAAVLIAASWIGTWATAPSSSDTGLSFTNVTLREIVHVSIGGSAVRVRLTNRFGNAPLVIGDASLAVAQGNSAAAVPGTLRSLAFSGLRSVTIPPRADVLSDPIALRIAPQSDMLISLFVPGPTGPATYHHLSYQDAYSVPGDRADQPAGDGFAPAGRNAYFVDAVDVLGTPARGAVVTLGDSITNGQGSTINGNDRWSDDLARRLLALPPAKRLGVLNAGIDGDRILLSADRFGPSALARLDDDVFAQSGVTDLIVLLGINDIQQTPHEHDPARIEFGLQQIVQRAHTHGIRVIGCTITPYEGWLTYDQRGERTRLAINQFIRTSGLFDGVADFDAAVSDPNDPRRIQPKYDSGDHLHPNAAAYQVMAGAIDLSQL